jgi:TPR repeat protein
VFHPRARPIDSPEDKLVSVKLKKPLLWICMGLMLLGGCKNSMVGQAGTSGADSPEAAACWEEADRLYDADQQPAALAIYLRCAGDGHAEAQYIAGHMLLFGDGAPRQPAEGLAWLEKSADQGHLEALRALGTYCCSGDFGVAQDPARSRALFEQAATQNDGFAMMMLGYLHQTGSGGDRNPELAAFWYRKASETGFPVPPVLMDATIQADAKPSP